nr:MAG TPA: hypothetical protein [Caudoviricetes sp.]
MPFFNSSYLLSFYILACYQRVVNVLIPTINGRKFLFCRHTRY